jgi:hypothetical protein
MSQLAKLQAATTLAELAELLGYTAVGFGYVAYGIPKAERYSTVSIPKKGGGERVLSIPNLQLKNLQARVHRLISSCRDEIALSHKRSSAAHGFVKHRSIITNADHHRSRNFVFNIDLANFFPSIHFGRVRGFLVNNRDFKLDPKIAEILAHIACNDHGLPQGSPCSPIFSNLIAQILDVHLSRLGAAHQCAYTRYADDITFSTNAKVFPVEIGIQLSGPGSMWLPGAPLVLTITQAGFRINPLKTRMDRPHRRQQVTGLVVNQCVNVSREYRLLTRAMVHRMVTGKLAIVKSRDSTGPIEAEISPDKLRGRLSFIHSVRDFPFKKVKALNPKETPPKADSSEKTYRRFLFHRYFVASPLPMIICEGKTDGVYVACAIRSRAALFPVLAQAKAGAPADLNVNLLRYSAVVSRLLSLDGGSSPLKAFIEHYYSNAWQFEKFGQTFSNPVIVLFDNDHEGLDAYKQLWKTTPKTAVQSDVPDWKFYKKNLYVVWTPLISGMSKSVIEHCFPDKVTKMTLGTKTFSWENKFNVDSQYGKALFASEIVQKRAAAIDFSGFDELLHRFSEVIVDFRGKAAAASST